MEEDFKYIVRIAGTDIDGNRPVKWSLTGLKGIGHRLAFTISKCAGIDPQMKMGNLSDEEVSAVENIVVTLAESSIPSWMLNRRKDYVSGKDKHNIGADLDMQLREDILKLRGIRAYRGIRHERGLKVRGQRTRSTGRKGVTVGVKRKKVIQAQQKR